MKTHPKDVVANLKFLILLAKIWLFLDICIILFICASIAVRLPVNLLLIPNYFPPEKIPWNRQVIPNSRAELLQKSCQALIGPNLIGPLEHSAIVNSFKCSGPGILTRHVPLYDFGHMLGRVNRPARMQSSLFRAEK